VASLRAILEGILGAGSRMDVKSRTTNTWKRSEADGTSRRATMAKAKTSAAILPYRINSGRLEVFLVHPGGPFWAKKDLGAWSLAKGEFESPEEPLEAALREFREETGFEVVGSVTPLEPRKQPSGKTVYAWATEAAYDPASIRSNSFQMEWPKGSGTMREFPEIDRAGWFDIEEGRKRVLAGHVPFLEQLEELIGGRVQSEAVKAGDEHRVSEGQGQLF
jgi:predicted NUDIX family NTP pyrophosphohydrolase